MSEPRQEVGYALKPGGIHPNVAAVWMILKSNWPSQFEKNVDKQDKADAWRYNLHKFTESEMQRGLEKLALYDSRYMPNPPQCRAIIIGANPNREEEQEKLEALPPGEVQRITWGAYFVFSMGMIGLGYRVTPDHARECEREGKRLNVDYRFALEDKTLPLDEIQALQLSLKNILLRAWMAICGIEDEHIKDWPSFLKRAEHASLVKRVPLAR